MNMADAPPVGDAAISGAEETSEVLAELERAVEQPSSQESNSEDPNPQLRAIDQEIDEAYAVKDLQRLHELYRNASAIYESEVEKVTKDLEWAREDLQDKEERYTSGDTSVTEDQVSQAQTGIKEWEKYLEAFKNDTERVLHELQRKIDALEIETVKMELAHIESELRTRIEQIRAQIKKPVSSNIEKETKIAAIKADAGL